MMKKKYASPKAEVIALTLETHLLVGSLTTDGIGNTGILPDEGGFNGSFQGNKRGWNSDNWSGGEEE